MSQTARETTVAQPELVAATLLSAMAGISRTMLESGVTRATLVTMQIQLTLMIRAHLEASAQP